jgi:putative DNA primase/helicase
MLGYLLLPTTKGQKCFIFIGNGGEGKSIWSYLLYKMFGNAFISRKVSDLENNRFSLPDLEDKLVCFNDDLTKKALNSTEMFKQLVTNISLIVAEQKYSPSYSFIPYARIVACSNYMLTSLSDHSDGFFRRILPIVCKPLDVKREDITDLHLKIEREIPGIFQWALAGLQRLMKNNYKFTVTERSETKVNQVRADLDNIQKFVNDDLDFGSGFSVSGKDLIGGYNNWCRDSGDVRLEVSVVRDWFNNQLDTLRIKKSTNVKTVSGMMARGYVGMRLNKQRSGVITIG